MKRITWIALASFVLVGTAQAASFDCGKAQSKVEKLICENSKLSALDEGLNRSYQDALEKTRLDDDEQMVSSQRQWLRKRNKCSDEQCLIEIYSSRIKEINDVYQFFGAYQGFSRACEGTILVLTPESMGLGDCRGIPYDVIESEKNHVVLKPRLASKCSISTIKLSIEEPSNGLPTFGGYVVEWNQGRCNYGPVDFSMSEDQTAVFMNSKIGEERADALHKINLQGRPDRQKYNEIGLLDSSSKVRSFAASFFNTELNKLTPILLKIIASDPDQQVRFSATMNLTCQFTCNGTEYTDEDIRALEENLPLIESGIRTTESEEMGRMLLEMLDFVWCDLTTDTQKKLTSLLSSDLTITQKTGSQISINHDLNLSAKRILNGNSENSCGL